MPNIYVADDGMFGGSESDHTTPMQLDSMINEISTDSITIYLHGGLVNRRRGENSARKFSNQIGEETTPLCLIWESGPFQILYNKLGSALTTTLTTVLYRRAKKILAGKFGGAGLIESTDEQLAEMMIHQLRNSQKTENELLIEYTSLIETLSQNDSELFDDLESIEPDINDVKPGFSWIKGGVVLAKVLAKSTYRFIKRRNHEIIPTLLEEIFREVYIEEAGTFLWNEMKDKVKKMFTEGEPNSYVGTGLLERLSALSETRASEGKELTVNIVGQSAGTIAICHALDTVASSYPNLKLNKIVFIAAAVTTEQAVNSVVTNQEHFNEFRMFTMRDELEKKDSVMFGYTASLLYLISGLLEGDNDKALAGMMRFHSDDEFSNRDFVSDWRNFITTSDRLVLSTTGEAPDGFESNSTGHGGFGTEKYTVKSIKHFIHM